MTEALGNESRAFGASPARSGKAPTRRLCTGGKAMHVVIWWLTGIVIGGISHFVGMRRRDGLLGDVSLGIVGGALSGCLSLRLGLAPASPALVHAAVAAGGAVVTIGVTRLLLRLSERESILMPARRHVSSVRTLEAQVSQLGEAECCVLSKLLEHEPIARDYDADFDRQLGVADRLADRVARFGGSWSFIGLSAALLLTWLFYNSATPGPFDPYPFSVASDTRGRACWQVKGWQGISCRVKVLTICTGSVRFGILFGISGGDSMHAGKLVFAQVMEFAPWHTFRRLVAKYRGDFNVRSFSCLDQFLCLAFAQLTYRESLRDIEACLRAQPAKLYHLGLRGNVSRSALADANEERDWRIYYEFAQSLIRIARRLYAEEPIGVELTETVYALDSTTIDLCLALFPWAPFRATKAAVKLHTLLDLRGSIPTFVHISDGKLHDVNVLDLLTPEHGAFYVMDRGYLDFERLFTPNQAGAFFVTRAKSNSKFKRLLSRPVDRSTGLICDQCIELVVFYSHQGYPERLRRIVYRDPERNTRLVFLTNHMSLPALTVCALYKSRWQVELFFKWVKQHLRIKRFFGTSENAVKTQVWTAVAVYVLVAIIRKQLDLKLSLHSMLQILSVTPFEKASLFQLLTEMAPAETSPTNPNQLIFVLIRLPQPSVGRRRAARRGRLGAGRRRRARSRVRGDRTGS